MLSGLEIAELEKRLFQYRIKRKIPYFIVCICLIIGLIAYFFAPNVNSFVDINFSRNAITQTYNETNKTSKSTLSLTQDSNASSTLTLNQDKNKTEESLVLKLPKIVYNASSQTNHSDAKAISDIQEEEMYTKPTMRKPSNRQDDSFYRSQEDQIDGSLLPPPPPLEEMKPQGVIKIETHVINSLSYLKEKFDSTHRIVYALMLAEEYYKNKNYNESNKWALIANNIDAENEKSWLWFSKSKYKLGHKDDAILALKAFLKNHQSQELKNLLEQIISDAVNE